MEIDIYCTSDGVVTYPLHSHKNYEILYYLKGEGVLKTEQGEIPYHQGNIIIVPPFLMHGSSSENGFKNISVNCDFKALLNFNEPILLKDNEKREGRMLAELLYDNRFQNREFLSSLCETYVLFVLTKLKSEDTAGSVVRKIMEEISAQAYNGNFQVKEVLVKSGYAEDYIRNKFKMQTGKTPTKFLTEIRINHARFLIDIYKDSMAMSEIAEKSGFTDYVYFSKRFKQFTGLSPNEYRNRSI